MANFKKYNTKAKDLIVDDRFKVAGQTYRIIDLPVSRYGNRNIHIVASLLGGDNRYDTLTVFAHPFAKFKIYKQDYTQK